MSFQLVPFTRHDVYPFVDPRQGLSEAALGRTVLVTGAGEGIGRGIAEAFALAGARCIILAARRTRPLEETKNSIARLLRENGSDSHCEIMVRGNFDVGDQRSVESLFEDLLEDGNYVPDVLVQNAAVMNEAVPVAKTDAKTWLKEIDINFKGTYLICQAFLKSLDKTGKTWGRIINVTSIGSYRYVSGLSPYSTSKAAMNTLSEYIDKESVEAGKDIRCVAMHPGGVMTTMANNLPDPVMKYLIDTKELAGGTAVYLSTNRADFLMGRYVSATADMEELEKLKDQIVTEDLFRTKVVGLDWRF